MGAVLGLSSPVPPLRRAPVSKRHTLQGTGTAFTRWSDNLYCSGASGQSCRLPNAREVPAGMCHWQKQHAQHRWLPVEEADMNVTNRAAFVGHRWDPLRPHGPRRDESGESDESGFRHFGRDEASRCLQGKRVLVAGDSTTRDTFYELVTVPPASPLWWVARLGRRTATPRAWQVAGHGGQIMRNLPNESRAYWADGAYAPRDPGGTMADRQGWCMGNHDKRQSCLRDLHVARPDGGRETRFSFQFLTRARARRPSPRTPSTLPACSPRPVASQSPPPHPSSHRHPRPPPSPSTLGLPTGLQPAHRRLPRLRRVLDAEGRRREG